MFAYVSEKITNHLAQTNVISQCEQDIYLFGVEQFLITVLNIVTTLAMGFLLGEVWQSLLLVFTFMILRSYAGGYHASTPVKCYLLTSSIIAIALSVIKYISVNIFICLGLLIIAGVVILLLSPVEAKNKPLDNIEFVIYRKKAILIWAVEFICAIICMLIDWKEFYMCIMLAHVTLAVSQITVRGKRKV